MSDELNPDVALRALDLAPVVIRDLEGRILVWTDAMQALCGYASSEAIGRVSDELLDTTFPRAAADIDAELHANGRWSGEVSYLRRDGLRIMVAAECRLLRSERGPPCAVAAFHVDLTRLKQAEGVRDLVAIMADSSTDAIICKTLQGSVTTWNTAAEEMFGYAAAEILGQPLSVLFPPELAAQETEVLERLSRGEPIEPYETSRLRKDGTLIEVSISVSPGRDFGGKTVGAAEIVRNITEQKLVRARLDEVQSELFHVSRLNDMGHIATGLAHELNQPLSAIGNYIAGARKLIERGELVRAIEGCDLAARQVIRVGDVIRRLRDFVAKPEPQRRPEDLGHLIEESSGLALLGPWNNAIRMELRIAPDAASAVVDKVQVKQVIVNIVRNAAEAMSTSPVRRLSVSTRRVGADRVEVAISDTGPGLPEAVRTRLFQPFISTKEGGMGVGLSLCRSIIEAHGGQIWAEGNPAGGAVFRFTLPSV
jgi:two-component system sensor kinase FixL